MKKSIGLDIGKEEIEASLYDGTTYRNKTYKNNREGIRRMRDQIKKESPDVITMEVTGTYYLRCAYELYESGFDVRVENPLVIKRFGQLKLRRTKTDKSDARLIALFGYNVSGRLFKPVSPERMKMRVLVKEIDQIFKDINRNISRIDALKQYPVDMAETIDRYESKNRQMYQEIDMIQKQLNGMIERDEEYRGIRRRLKTIKGVGDRLASALIAYVGNFEDFHTAKQLSAYFGITPMLSQSGTSVNTHGGINKMGNKYIRSLLRCCGLTAVQCNEQCIALKRRLVGKGMKHNEILIAAGHKLLRQCFGVVKNNTDYSPCYVRNTA